MSSYYPPPLKSNRPEPQNPLGVIAISGVVVTLLTFFSALSVEMPGGKMTLEMAISISLIAGLVGAVLGAVFAGRDWVGYKLSGGREPSILMQNALAAGTYGTIIFLVIAGFAIFLFHDMPLGFNKPEVAEGPPPPPFVPNPANMQERNHRVFPGGSAPPIVQPVPPPPPVTVPLPSIPLKAPVEPTPTPMPLPSPPVVASVDPPPTSDPFVPVEKPLEIPAGTSPKDANELFVARYGDAKVARFIINEDMATGDSETAFRDALANFVDAGQSPSIFISSAQTGTIAALVAPVSNLEVIAKKLGSAAQIKTDRRMIAVKASTLKASAPVLVDPFNRDEPKLDPAKTAAAERELKKLVAQLQKADVFSRKPIVAKIAALKIPAAAEALVKGLGTIDQHTAEEGLLQMGSVAFPALLAVAESDDFGAAAAALNILGKIGTPDIIPALEKIDNGNGRGSGFASFAIDAIKRRK